MQAAAEGDFWQMVGGPIETPSGLREPQLSMQESLCMQVAPSGSFGMQ